MTNSICALSTEYDKIPTTNYPTWSVILESCRWYCKFPETCIFVSIVFGISMNADLASVNVDYSPLLSSCSYTWERENCFVHRYSRVTLLGGVWAQLIALTLHEACQIFEGEIKYQSAEIAANIRRTIAILANFRVCKCNFLYIQERLWNFHNGKSCSRTRAVYPPLMGGRMTNS